MALLKWALAGVVAFFIIRACNNYIDPSKVESELNGNWSQFTQLDGTTDNITSVWEVPSGKVRVKWFTRNTGTRPGNFRMLAKRPDGRIINDICGVAVGAGGVRSGDRAFDKAPQFYLDIQSDVAWDVRIEIMQ